MKVRLKDSCSYDHMNTPYGLIDHNWKEVPEGSYVYKEMEAIECKEPKPEVKVEQPIIEPVKPVELKVEHEVHEVPEKKFGKGKRF